MDSNINQSSNELKFGLKSFITVCLILFSIIFLSGILTYVIPAGEYQRDEAGNIIPDSYTEIESDSRLPVYRWLTAPIEVGGQAVLGRQEKNTTPWLTERHGYDPT